MIYADLVVKVYKLHYEDEVKQDKRAAAETSSTEHESAGATPTYKFLWMLIWCNMVCDHELWEVL